MARKWKEQDSARTMTNKYNEVVDDVAALQQDSGKMNEVTRQAFNKVQEDLSKKAETKTDIGLGNVDNTADKDKPVSTAQAQAIEWATEEMLRSEPANEDITQGAEDTGFITSVSVSGTKLVISF